MKFGNLGIEELGDFSRPGSIPECIDHISHVPHQVFIIITDNSDYQGGNKVI